MDYSQLSDFEINRMVGDIIFKGLWASKPETSGNNTNKWYYGNADTTFEPLNHLPDYCNDPSALNRPGFPGECFICELRLPDHRFRWKHNKLFLLL
ncbi:hypothetical protein ABUT88_05805, partial [Escherichia coli]